MTEELKQAAPRNHGPIQETDLYDFAGWLTTRPGVMTVGRSCEVGPLSEAVAEYIKTFPERFALTQRPAAQAGEREAFIDWLETTWPKSHPKGSGNDYWRNGHVAALAWQARASLPTQPAAQTDNMGMPTSCGKPLCAPDEHHPLCDLHKSAAQATPSRDAREAEQRTRMQARLSSGKATADFDLPAPNDDIQQATPEPVGEVVAWRYKIPTHGGGTAWTHTRPQPECLIEAQPLYTQPAPGVPDFASLLKIKEPDGCAENIEQADRQEARCNGWNDCRDEVLNILAAAQAKGAGHG